MAQSENPNPKLQLSEAWAEKMACPICTSRPLGVFHPSGQADRFACPTCETSFELEDGGKRVRFVTLPQNVTPWMRGQWVVLEEALAAFEIFKNGQTDISLEKTSAVSPAGTPEPPVSPQSPADNISSETATPENTKILPDEKEEIEKPIEKSDSRLLTASDKVRNTPSTNSPFFEEDFSTLEISSDEKISSSAAQNKEFWKDWEAERVKEAIVHPPSSDFAGQLASKEITQPEEPVIKPLNGIPAETGQQEDANSRPLGLPKVSWPVEQPTSTPSPVAYPSLDNPPPIRPMEDTPPSIIQPAPMRPRPTFTAPEEYLGDLRSHITGASNAPSVIEKMEAASERALELHKLGNTDQEVRSILERSSGLTPEQVADVLRNLEKPEERKQSFRLILIFSIVAVVIFTLLTWWFFSSRSLISPTDTTQPTGNAFSLSGKLVDAASLPAPLQTMMPNGIQILNEAPSVETSTEGEIPAASCPTSNEIAASLFGGPAADWTKDTKGNGWILVTKTQGVSIKIPANMTGGYLVFEKGPEMRGVGGPAIVRNIYMISISCQ